MTHETTAPVQSLVDEILAELDQSAAFHRELNTSNYDHDDVCRLNDWGVDACTALEKAAELIRQQRKELKAIEAMVGMLEEGEWAEHVGQLGGPIAQRLETEITRMHNEQQALIVQSAAPAAVPDELRAKAEKFVISRRQAAEFDRVAESELEDEDADEAQACAVQAFFHEEAAALVEQLLSAAPTPPAQQPVAVPDGYKIVPLEPTPEMITAGEHAVSMHAYESGVKRAFWDAMLAAAPAAPLAQQPVAWVRKDAPSTIKAAEFGAMIAASNRNIEPFDFPLYAAPPAQQSQWVPVSERLPEIDTPVFLYEPNFGIWIGGCADADDGWMWAHAQGTQWFADGKWKADLFIDDDYKPSHWIPLPAAPGGTAAPEQAEQPHPVNRSVIRDVFLRNGFTIKEGHDDLKPYVYAAAEELLALDGKEVAAEQDAVTVPRELLERVAATLEDCAVAWDEAVGDGRTLDQMRKDDDITLALPGELRALLGGGE